MVTAAQRRHSENEADLHRHDERRGVFLENLLPPSDRLPPVGRLTSISLDGRDSIKAEDPWLFEPGHGLDEVAGSMVVMSGLILLGLNGTRLWLPHHDLAPFRG
jgi:hypothetical protein